MLPISLVIIFIPYYEIHEEQRNLPGYLLVRPIQVRLLTNTGQLILDARVSAALTDLIKMQISIENRYETR